MGPYKGCSVSGEGVHWNVGKMSFGFLTGRELLISSILIYCLLRVLLREGTGDIMTTALRQASSLLRIPWPGSGDL